MKLIKYVETVEVPTNSTTKTKFYFQEQPNLRNKRILYIDVFTTSYVTQSPSNKNLVNDTVISKSFLVLVSKNKEIVNRIPLRRLFPVFQFEHRIFFDLIVDFPKSYIEIGSIASLSATETFLFSFYCHDQVKNIHEYRGINIENIEVKTTPATLQKFYFPDHENLKGKKIQFIEYIYSAYGITPSGDSIVNATVEKKSYMTLSQKGQEIIKKIPIYPMVSTNFAGYLMPFDNLEIDFPNSYFEISNTNDTVAGEIFFLNVYFYDRILGKT